MRLRLNLLCLPLIFIFSYDGMQAQCYDEDLVEPDGICTLILAPVCGCNGVTYSNSCVAEKFGGVSSYTNGPCHPQYYSVMNQDFIDMGYVFKTGGPEGAVLSEDRSLFTVFADEESAEFSLTENFGTGFITKLVLNPKEMIFKEPLAITSGSPTEVASFKKVGAQHELSLTKDDLQKTVKLSPTGLTYSNATDGTKSFGIDFENNSVNIGNLEIVNLGKDNLGLEGDVIPINSGLNYDIGNNVAGEHWDDVVATDFIVFSDRRLKNNIKSSQYGLSAVMKLEPVQYQYKQSIDVSGAERLGFIAQDVKKIIPHVVHDSDMELTEDRKTYKKVKREHLSMSYQDLIPVLTKAIQEQQNQIELMTKELAVVKQQLAEK